MSQPPTPYNPQQNRSLANIIAALGPQSKVAEQSTLDPRALAAGIKASFGVMTYKGKTWGIRHKGTTLQLLQRDHNGAIVGAVPTVDIIIVRSAAAISKSYYIEKYKEGDFNQPDCWSTNGVRPDPASPHIQNPTCKGCKWDAFGSRRMDDGRNAKACSDNKRLAVVPAADIKNEAYGGPMLLKLMPSAFNALSELEVQLHMQGYRYFGLVMRLSFDHTVAFPKIMFTPIRVLNDHEMTEVVALQKSDVVDRILSEEAAEVSADPKQPDPQEETRLTTSPPLMPRPEGHEVTAFNPTPPPSQPVITPGTTLPPGYFVPTGQQVNIQSQPTTTNGTAAPQAAETPAERIARLEAALAAATAKPQRGRKRSTPVTPTGNVQVTTPEQQAKTAEPSFTQHAVEGNGIPEEDEEGDAPADLDDRIDKLLKP